jgi:signal transduction histidine kinase/DNA-binding response OmpR family regulator
MWGIKQKIVIFLWSTMFISITDLNGQSLSNLNRYIADTQHLSIKDGLSHRNVLSVFQDRDDVIWLGTQNGLNRFDGYRFKHWLGKDQGVDLKYIFSITQDDAGWLWIRTGLENKNLIFFNPKTEIFQTVKERFGEDCVLSDIYLGENEDRQCFPTDKDGTVFFYKRKENKTVLYSYRSSVGFSKISTPAVLKNKEYWINYISGEGDFFIEYADFNLVSDKVKTAVLSLSKNALVLIRYGKVKARKSYKKIKEVNYENGQTWDINNNILSVYDAYQDLIVSLDDIPIDYPRGFYFDKKNRAWVHTQFGVYLIELKKNQFSFFKNIEYNNGRSLPVRGVVANSTEMTVAFQNVGVGQYDFKSKQWSYIRIDGGYLNAIYASEYGLWISGLSNINLWKNGQLATYPIFVYKGGAKIEYGVWCIFPSNISKNKLWLGAERGFLLFNTESKKSQLFINPLIKGDYHVQTIIRDKQHKNWLWLCSNKGLILFDEAKERFLNLYSFNQSKKQFLPTDDVQHLHQDEEGIYWLATVDGVIRWDKAKNKYRQLTVANGLPDNVVYAMYPDDYGNLWMSSDYGIIQMNKTTFAIKNYSPEDGIGQQEFNRISHFSYRDKKGVQRLFFGGLGGVTVFYPKDFQADKQEIKPTLAVLKYQQFDGCQKAIVDYTATLIDTKKIIIESNDYIHLLEVGLLNYNNVENNQYRYQIKVNGKSSDWIMQKSRFIQIGRLPFGTHQLIITGNTLNNISAVNELTIDIIIRRPFYLTWWFVLIAIVTIAGSIIYYFNSKNSRLKVKQIELESLVRNRTKKIEADKTIIEKQATELREIDGIKSRFFANISHELRTPITLIQGPIQSALNSQDLNNRNFTLLTKANQNTKKLIGLVNEILDLTKLDAHKLVLEETTVAFYTFLRSVISNFESIANVQETDLLFISEIPTSLKIEVDKNKLEKVLNNLLSNAFKFTPKNGKIIVHTQDLGNIIQISVKDNGRGIPAEDIPNIFNRFYQSSMNSKAEGGLGIGLALSAEFVKLMKGKVWVESQKNATETGSTFYLQFPKKEVVKMITTEEQLIINDETKVITAPILLSENAPTEFKDETILIVEDNHDLREYLSYILSPYYNIITAENGQEGLEKLPTAHCQLILSDVMMPIMDGFEFLEKVKAHDKWRGLPFIMLTARAETYTRLNALRIGVDDYLLKPFDEEELFVRVKNLLGNYRERKIFIEEEALDESIASIEPIVSAADQQWLEQTEKLILKEMNNPIFSNDYLAELLSINRNVLYEKIKSLTGLTPTKYIRVIRLQKAKNLLAQGKTIKEVSYEVGFQKPEYFSKMFKKQFGKLPSE